MPLNHTPIVQMEHVSFEYNSARVLDDINFTISAGEFVGIIGPNGSGKTTLLRLILGLLTPQEGSVLLFGKKSHLGQNAQEIGYIPQKVTQLETRFPITVEEVVALGRVSQRGLFRQLNFDDRQAITEALDLVQLTQQRGRLITDLSGGQQQRVFIAKALATRPKVLILDEPTVGVDIESQEKFYQLLAQLNKEHGLTIIIVSHDIDVVVNEVSTVLCVNKTLIYDGTPKEFIKEDYIEKLYGKGRRFILHNH